MKKGFAHERGVEGETNTWLTPPEMIRDLGPFDLDPCAAVGQPWPTATTQYTVRDDGLSKPWNGYVWMNPPYGPNTGYWLERLAEHGNGIALVFARTETAAFFNHVWGHASAIRFIRGRVSFHRTSGKRMDPAPAPSVLIAYGELATRKLSSSKIDGVFVALPSKCNKNGAGQGKLF